MNSELERMWFELVCDMQRALGTALNSLEGRESDGLLDHYLVFSSAHVNRAAEAYAFLRGSSRLCASRLLIRPAIEACIRIIAVRAKPELLYQLAYTERSDDRKWMRDWLIKAGHDFDREDERRWTEFTETYRTHFPDHKLKKAQISLKDIAKEAGIEQYYETHYRLYCRFTHGALPAIAGELNSDGEDNRTMALCLWSALAATHAAGGDAPTATELRARLHSMATGGLTMPPNIGSTA